MNNNVAKVLPFPQVIAVNLRDADRTGCLRCDTGEYLVRTVLDLHDGTVTCNNCRHVIARWITKQEVLKIRADMNG